MKILRPSHDESASFESASVAGASSVAAVCTTLLAICERSLRETLGLVLQGVGMLGIPGATGPSTHTNELHASKHASSKSLDIQSFLPSLSSKKPPLFFSSQSFLFLTLFLVLGVFFPDFLLLLLLHPTHQQVAAPNR
jgi:hypothetical protein